jgi:head-tail adaptor
MAIGVAASINERTRRVTLDAPGPPVPDGDGGYTQDYAPLDPPALFAKVEPATAHSLERLTAGTITTTITHVLTLPFHPTITTATRVQWTDDARRPHTANVTAVNNVDERCITLVLGAVEVVD